MTPSLGNPLLQMQNCHRPAWTDIITRDRECSEKNNLSEYLLMQCTLRASTRDLRLLWRLNTWHSPLCSTTTLPTMPVSVFEMKSFLLVSWTAEWHLGWCVWGVGGVSLSKQTKHCSTHGCNTDPNIDIRAVSGSAPYYQWIWSYTRELMDQQHERDTTEMH